MKFNVHTFLNGIGLENFRVFSDKTYFDLAPITIFTGTNNSGKSSVAKGLNLLKNFLIKREGAMNDDETLINPDIVDIEELMGILGDFSKLTNHNSHNDITSFYFPLETFRGVSIKLELRIDFKLLKGSLKQGKLVGLTILKSENKSVVFSCSEIEELKYNIKINYFFFLQEYKNYSNYVNGDRGAILLKSSLTLYEDLYEEDNLFLDYLEHLLYSETDELLVFNNGIDNFWKSGTDFFELSKDEYNDIEKEFLEKFEYTITYHNATDQEDLTGIKPIQKSLSERWYETKRKTKSIETIYESIAYPSFCFGNSGMFFKFGEANFYFDQQANLIELHQNGSDFMLKEFAFDNYDNNMIANHYKEGLLYFKPSFRELKEADNDLSMSEFFFKYFVCNNIRYSIFETLYKSSITSTHFIGGIKSPVQRLYTKAENPLLTDMLGKILEAKEGQNHKDCIDFIDRYLKIFEIGTHLEIERNAEGLGTYVYLVNNGKRTALADMGYGVSQVLPLILKIAIFGFNWDASFLSRLFVEEPEANLHPALQSKLADMFVEANETFAIRFIIETHSEYLIRKFQYLTASNKSQLKPEDTVLYYFYHPDRVPSGEPQVKKINILEDGSLSDDFGRGFFDEADNIAMEIFLLNQSQKN